MHENGIVAEAGERLRLAGLMPPVRSLEWLGSEDEDDPQDESVLVDVTGPVSAELEERLEQALRGLAHGIRLLPPNPR